MMRTQMKLIGNPEIDWAFSFNDPTPAQAADYYRRKDPSFLEADPSDQSSFYLMGTYKGQA